MDSGPPDSAAAAEELGLDAGLRRARLEAILWLVLGLTALLVAFDVATARWLVGGFTAALLAMTAVVLFMLRRGWSELLVGLPYLAIAGLTNFLMGMVVGSDALGSLLSPVTVSVLALLVGGHRVGVVAAALCLASTVGMLLSWEQRASTPSAEHILGFIANFVVLVGVVLMHDRQTAVVVARLIDRNRQLATAQAEADRANQAKSQFLATISHEIRTPLNGVTGMVALLEGQTEPTVVREGLRVVKQSADTLLAVINDVLDFSKIESNSLELEYVSLSPEDELLLVVNLVQGRAAERNTTVSLTVGPQTPGWIRGDPTRLRQIAMNLVSNAVKFTRDGRVDVRLDALGDWLVLAIQDTGIGIAPEARERIFQPFTQADASTTRRFGGTGLGLAITHRLVTAMGGDISLDSTLGQGSTFTVRLPLLVAAPPEAVARTSDAPAVALRVLIVEDNPVNQLVARKLVERLGHTVTLAEDGQEAVDGCAQASFDLILMDCHMPRMDGYEAARALRSRGLRIPIYALTAAVTVEDRQRCLASGMDDVLSKPLRVERLHEALQTVAQGLAPRLTA